MVNRWKQFWHYWTDTVQLREDKKVEYWPTSGDGHSFDDSSEEVVTISPVYGTRIGSLFGTLAALGAMGGLISLLAFNIHKKNVEEKAITENRQITYQVESIGLSLTDKQWHQFIRELGIPYHANQPRHDINLYASLEGATWSIGEKKGVILRTTLDDYLTTRGKLFQENADLVRRIEKHAYGPDWHPNEEEAKRLIQELSIRYGLQNVPFWNFHLDGNIEGARWRIGKREGLIQRGTLEKYLQEHSSQ